MKKIKIFYPAHWDKEGQEAGLEHIQSLLRSEDFDISTHPYEQTSDVSSDQPAIIVLPNASISRLAQYYAELKLANPLHLVYYDEELYDIEGDDRHSQILTAVDRMLNESLMEAMKPA